MIFTFFVGVGLAFLLGLLGVPSGFVIAFLVLFFLVELVARSK